METETNTKSTITPPDRAMSQLENTILPLSHHHSLCILSVLNKSLYIALVKICTNRDDPLFHSCFDSVVKKMFPTRCIFHGHKTSGSQKVPNPDYMVCVTAQFSQAWQCARQSSNRCVAWCVARERLSHLGIQSQLCYHCF